MLLMRDTKTEPNLVEKLSRNIKRKTTITHEMKYIFNFI